MPQWWQWYTNPSGLRVMISSFKRCFLRSGEHDGQTTRSVSLIYNDEISSGITKPPTLVLFFVIRLVRFRRTKSKVSRFGHASTFNREDMVYILSLPIDTFLVV